MSERYDRGYPQALKRIKELEDHLRMAVADKEEAEAKLEKARALLAELKGQTDE